MPNFDDSNNADGKNTRILALCQKIIYAWSLYDIRIAAIRLSLFKKFSDLPISEEVIPPKRLKILFDKMGNFTCIQALKFRVQALFHADFEYLVGLSKF